MELLVTATLYFIIRNNFIVSLIAALLTYLFPLMRTIRRLLPPVQAAAYTHGLCK